MFKIPRNPGITNRVIRVILQRSDLEDVMLGDTAIDSSGVIQLGNTSKLNQLSLQRLALDGDCLVPIAQLPKLTVLHLGETGISDVALAHLKAAPAECWW